MSCIKCEQEPIETYIRIDNGNVMVTGCREHLKTLLEVYKAGRAQTHALPDAVSKAQADKLWNQVTGNDLQPSDE